MAGSLLLRLSLFDFESGDYRFFLTGPRGTPRRYGPARGDGRFDVAEFGPGDGVPPYTNV
ncbi:MAG: hypothetical protein M5U12_36225 [Verrucomicrobia bacterium]|nr:hypothetical protein [Verrucomicrobiota bacterium]